MLDQDLLELGLRFHGHKCPAMPMGLRTGLAAMNALGVEHAADGQLVALVEIDEDHCATCFADGVQVATGCTFGKGNIRRLGYGKFGLTLVDKRTQRAVRVVPKGGVMMKNRESEFMKLRSSGTPASQIPVRARRPADRQRLRGPRRGDPRRRRGRATTSGMTHRTPSRPSSARSAARWSSSATRASRAASPSASPAPSARPPGSVRT